MKIIRKVLLTAAVLLLACAGVVIYSYYDQDQLSYEFYHLHSGKVAPGETIRVVALSDLHDKEFGEGNADLIEAVAKMKPDLILIAGDMVDYRSADTSVALNLCLELQKTAPLYYGFGNHESRLVYVDGIGYDQELKDAGIPLLISSAQSITVKDTPVDIGSIAASDGDDYDTYAADFVREFEEYEAGTHLKLMITHFPSLYYEKMKDARFDLGICGHLHGGQIRLPILGGVYSERDNRIEFFPRYCYGKFELSGCTIIVSRGLGNHERLPRINNRPEITVIDINARVDNAAGADT